MYITYQQNYNYNVCNPTKLPSTKSECKVDQNDARLRTPREIPTTMSQNHIPRDRGEQSGTVFNYYWQSTMSMSYN